VSPQLRLVVFAHRPDVPADKYGYFVTPERMRRLGWEPAVVANNPDRAEYCAVDFFKVKPEPQPCG
jgi:hypothetical protein